MRRILIGVAAVVLVAIGVYLAGPYYTLWRLVQAARAHDIKVVSQIVDIPSVRASLKPQLTVALQAQLERQRPKPQNLLEQIGAAIAPVFVGNAVDTVITPEGVDADAVRKTIYERFDCSLGTGLGKVKGRMFRIGHLGDCNDLTLLAALAGCEMGMKLAGIGLAGSGVQAAMDYFAGHPAPAIAAK